MLAIVIGYLRRLNIGLLSIAFAFIIGHFLVGLNASDIIGGWPLSLFFMLLAMTLLFGIAQANGTLSLLAGRVVELTGGRRRLIPPAFFLMSGLLAASGAGNISICALVSPIAMTVSIRQRIPAFLMAAMVIAGANAGGFSPIAPAGIIGVTLAEEIGIPGTGLIVFRKQIIAQSILAAGLYFLLKGHRLTQCLEQDPAVSAGRINRAQKTTIAVFVLVIGAIVLAGWNIGLTAFTGTVVLLFLRAADEETALKAVPWSTIILVCGVGMLVHVAQMAGGIALMADVLARFMHTRSAAPIMAVTGGILSTASSASGVVMPTLIPMVPAIVEETGADGVRVIASIITGSHMVTNSPLSTLGALAVAAAGQQQLDQKKLFKDLFILAVAGLAYAALIVWLEIV